MEKINQNNYTSEKTWENENLKGDAWTFFGVKKLKDRFFAKCEAIQTKRDAKISKLFLFLSLKSYCVVFFKTTNLE